MPYKVNLSGIDFTDSSIISGSINIYTTVDLSGAELAYDTFTVIVDFEAGEYVLFSPADYDGVITEDSYLFGTADITTGDLAATPYGTPINLYDGDTLLAKFYVHDVVRVGRTQYKINAMSAIGFLENTQHLGGVYTNKTVSQLIAEIVNGAFTYTVDQTVANQAVSGWLPIDTSRNNLHQLLFAMGITIAKDSNGNVVFKFLSGGSPTSVGDGRIYLGGSVDYNALATAVSVSEHSFYQTQNTPLEQIFSNVGGVTANNLLVQFSGPYWDLQSSDPSNFTIVEAGDNYAIVSGVGILSGKPYTHDTKVYQEDIQGATGIVPNVITSDEDTLVNSLNVLNVLKRLVSYYGSRKTVSADIIVDGEKSGDSISFTDAFGDATVGIITQMDMLASTIIKAQSKIVTDYTPTGQGNFYQNRVLISSSGTWTVPAGVTGIRIALVGGGGGGQGGYDGEEGAGGEYDPDWGEYGDLIPYRDRDAGYLGYHYRSGSQPLKKGGVGGEPGEPGKTYVIDKEVVPGEVITIVVGTGGAGGASNGTDGSAGTATTAASTSFGALSSESGTSTDAGYYDVLSGLAFATAGVVGYAGGDGGQTDVTDLLGWNGSAGLSGGNVSETYLGGAGGTGMNTEDGDYRASGGGGGGAAYGANGGAGGAGTVDNHDVYCGDGGDGADALPPPQAFYGCAGDGGNGGGAGGNAGGGYNKRYYSSFNYRYENGDRGQPGQGSVGGQGGAGCVIIYY